MDPKKQGIVFEALTYLALRKATKKTINWGVKPKGFSIDPDFIVGDVESPVAWIMVTSNGSAKEFDKKFWRNVAEIFAVKRAFSNPPIVIDLVFKESQKAGLQSALAAICDGYINVEKEERFNPLIEFVNDLPDDIASNKQAKVDRLEEKLENQSKYRPAFSSLVAQLKHEFIAKATQHRQFWELIRTFQAQANGKKAKVTTVRRGIGKLLLVPEDLRFVLLRAARLDSLVKIAMPEFLLLSGLVQQVTGGYRVADSDVSTLAASLPEEEIDYIIRNSPLEKMAKWIDPIVGLGGYVGYDEYFKKNWTDLSTPKGMYTRLRRVQLDPTLGGRQIDASSNWLYSFGADVIKASANKSQAFGYSKLGSLVKDNKDDINRWLATQDLPSLTLKGKSIIVRGLTDWVNRLETTHAKSFSESFQGAVAWVLANELAKIDIAKRPSVEEISAMAVNTFLEKKIIPYRYFEPLPLLIEHKLKTKGIKFKRILAHQTVLGEMVSDPRIATTPVYLVGNTIVHWKSAPKNPRDKTKELCGRGVALRLTFNGREFTRRHGLDRMCLVLDGAFTTGQLHMLKECGWDEVFYPDEMDKLAAFLK